MSTKPKFIPYGTNPQLDKFIDTILPHDYISLNNQAIFTTLAQNGYALDKLADCKIDGVREEVAKWDYNTEKFLDDDCAEVQIAAIDVLCAKLRKERNISLPSLILKEPCFGKKNRPNVSVDTSLIASPAFGVIF